jgi:hypothetical protein
MTARQTSEELLYFTRSLRVPLVLWAAGRLKFQGQSHSATWLKLGIQAMG